MGYQPFLHGFIHIFSDLAWEFTQCSCFTITPPPQKGNIIISLKCILCRKQDLRELKMLQKLENRQHTEFMSKAELTRDQQEKRFESELAVT